MPTELPLSAETLALLEEEPPQYHSLLLSLRASLLAQARTALVLRELVRKTKIDLLVSEREVARLRGLVGEKEEPCFCCEKQCVNGGCRCEMTSGRYKEAP